jgi:hypothetical protein
MTSEKTTTDLGLRFQTQDTEWLLNAVELMMATGMATSCSEEARIRMERFRKELSLKSPLPPRSGSYGDAFRFNDALAAVKTCDSWEVRLLVDRSSYFKDVTFFIETFEFGKRKSFKLTSDLRLGPDAKHDADPYEIYGVYANRLIETCQEVAPPKAKMLTERTVKMLVDWRAFDVDNKDKIRDMAGLLAADIAAPFAVRDAKIAWWTIRDGKLPEHLRYADVVVSTTEEGHKNLDAFVEGFNERVLAASGPTAKV